MKPRRGRPKACDNCHRRPRGRGYRYCHICAMYIRAKMARDGYFVGRPEPSPEPEGISRQWAAGLLGCELPTGEE